MREEGRINRRFAEAIDIIRAILYCRWQWTWRFLQSALGLVNFIIHIHDKHYFYHCAGMTEWKDISSVSLGMFVFATSEPYFYGKLLGKKLQVRNQWRIWGLFENCQHAQSAGLFSAEPRCFALKYTKYFCAKSPCPAKKFLDAGHIANFQTAPSNRVINSNL